MEYTARLPRTGTGRIQRCSIPVSLLFGPLLRLAFYPHLHSCCSSSCLRLLHEHASPLWPPPAAALHLSPDLPCEDTSERRDCRLTMLRTPHEQGRRQGGRRSKLILGRPLLLYRPSFLLRPCPTRLDSTIRRSIWLAEQQHWMR